MQNFSFGSKMAKPLSPQFRQSISQTQFQAYQQIPKLLASRASNEGPSYMQGLSADKQPLLPSNSPYLTHNYHQYQNDNEQDEQNDNSFYSAYLKVQEQKFQQQLINLRNIDEKIKQICDVFVPEIPITKDLFIPHQIKTQRQNSKSNQIQRQQQIRKYQSQLLQFAYILGQLVTLDSCKQNIKLKLRFRLFDILQLFNLSGKKIQRKQFYNNVSKVIGNSSHQYIDTLVKYIFHDQQQINRQQFTSIFKTNKRQILNNSNQTQTTSSLIKQFFSALCETIYFQNKLKKVAHEISYQTFEDAISKNKNFSSEDIQRFLQESVSVKLDIDSIDTLFSRIQKPRRAGDYVLTDFIEWLESKN